MAQVKIITENEDQLAPWFFNSLNETWPSRWFETNWRADRHILSFAGITVLCENNVIRLQICKFNMKFHISGIY